MWDSRWRLLFAVLVGLAVTTAACSGSSGSDGPENSENARAVGSASSPVADFDPSSSSPPAIVLQRGDSELSVMAFTYCWSPVDSGEGICADGSPPAEPLVLGGSGIIELYFPLPNFDFESRFFDASYSIEQPGASLTKVADHWEFDPPEELPAIIEVFGFNNNNDVIISFRVDE